MIPPPPPNAAKSATTIVPPRSTARPNGPRNVVAVGQKLLGDAERAREVVPGAHQPLSARGRVDAEDRAVSVQCVSIGDVEIAGGRGASRIRDRKEGASDSTQARLATAGRGSHSETGAYGVHWRVLSWSSAVARREIRDVVPAVSTIPTVPAREAPGMRLIASVTSVPRHLVGGAPPLAPPCAKDARRRGCADQGRATFAGCDGGPGLRCRGRSVPDTEPERVEGQARVARGRNPHGQLPARVDRAEEHACHRLHRRLGP
jgi:hypothetical protein